MTLTAFAKNSIGRRGVSVGSTERVETQLEIRDLGRLTLSLNEDGGFFLFASGEGVEAGVDDLLANGQFYSDGTVGLFPVQGDDLRLRKAECQTPS